MHQLLRRRLVAAVAALLRHGDGNPRPRFIQEIGWLGAQARGQALDRRLAWFAGRVFTANIDVAIGHDGILCLELKDQRALPRKVATRSIPLGRPAWGFGSPTSDGLLSQKG